MDGQYLGNFLWTRYIVESNRCRKRLF